MAVTVFLADDYPVVLAGLAALVETALGFKVVGSADRGDAAFDRILDLRPDIAVLDLGMPGLSGLEVLKKIRRAALPTKVILLTGLASDSALLDAKLSGAEAILLKESAADTLLDCLRAVGHGSEWAILPAIKAALEREQVRRQNWANLLQQLTSREQEIVRLALEGAINKQIAFMLGMAENTVKVHINSIFRKLKVSNRTELAALFLERSSHPSIRP